MVPPCESTNPFCPLVWHCGEGMHFWWFTPPFLVESYQKLDYCSPMTIGLLWAPQSCTMGRSPNQRFHTCAYSYRVALPVNPTVSAYSTFANLVYPRLQPINLLYEKQLHPQSMTHPPLAGRVEKRCCTFHKSCL